MRSRYTILLPLALLLLAMAAIPVLLSSMAATKNSLELPPTAESADLEVLFFDAGKADAILLTTENSAVLIDAGEKGFGKTILASLEEKGIERLDYLIVTHFDKDHVGGAAKVLHSVEVGTVLQNSYPKDSEEYEKYVKALSDAGIEPVTVGETYPFVLDGVLYTVDPPRQRKYSSDTSNNSSLIVTVQNGGNRFLFPGDARTERLKEFLEGGPATCDVLKVPHHGQEEPLLEELIEAVSPSYAIITSSEQEPEDGAVVKALEDSGAEVLLTRKGAVTIRSDGKGIQVSYGD